jgi:hypothetical protein
LVVVPLFPQLTSDILGDLSEDDDLISSDIAGEDIEAWLPMENDSNNVDRELKPRGKGMRRRRRRRRRSVRRPRRTPSPSTLNVRRALDGLRASTHEDDGMDVDEDLLEDSDPERLLHPKGRRPRRRRRRRPVRRVSTRSPSVNVRRVLLDPQTDVRSERARLRELWLGHVAPLMEAN